MADKKISELPASSALDTDDLLAVVEDGVTVKATVQDLLDLAPSGNGIPTVINVVTDYAAAGDGVTNDRTAIQNAIDACSGAGGGVVYFPENTYLIGVAGTLTGLTVPSEVTLRGAGPKASIIKSASTTAGVKVILGATSANQVRVESLGIDASSTTTSSSGVQFTTGTDCHVVDVWIANKFGWGVFFGTDSQYCQVVRCTIDGTTGAHGVEINGSSYCTVQGCHITNGGVNGSNNIELYDATATRIVGNKILGNTLIGSGISTGGGAILTAGDIGSIISDNLIINPASYGIFLAESNYDATRYARECVVSGNVIKGADAAPLGASGAIYLSTGARKNMIAGNTIEGTTGSTPGMKIDGVNNTISHNVVYLNGGHGILIASTAHCSTVVGNVCTDNSMTGVNARSGLRVEANDCTVVANTCSDTRGGSARQEFGTVVAGTDCMMFGNVGTGNGNGAVDAGTNTTVLGNDNYYTNQNRIPGYVADTIVDAKGDLFVGLGADSPSRLAVGADGRTLVADSAETSGLRWSVQSGAVVNTVAAAGATETLDGDDYNFHDVTLDVNVTFTFTTAATVSQFTLILRQDGTGGNSVTWPAEVKWHAATAPTILTTANAVHVLEFLSVNGGGEWRGFLASSSVS